jgi:hypothetical protein
MFLSVHILTTAQHPASLSGPSDESTATTTHRTAPTARA